MAAGHGGNQAVHQAAWRHALPAAATVDAGGGVEVGSRVDGEKVEAQKQVAEGRLSSIVSGTGPDLGGAE